MFAQSKSLTWINKNIRGAPPVETLREWRKQHNWLPRRKGLNDKADAIIDENLAQVKARQREVVKVCTQKFMARLANGTAEISAGQLVHILKHELLLAGEVEHKFEINQNISMVKILELAQEGVKEAEALALAK